MVWYFGIEAVSSGLRTGGGPGTDTESDKSSYSEKQEKEECRLDFSF